MVYVVTACDYGDFNVDQVFAKREDAVAHMEAEKAKEKKAKRYPQYQYDIVEREVK